MDATDGRWGEHKIYKDAPSASASYVYPACLTGTFA
jgi:hypothetical protein